MKCTVLFGLVTTGLAIPLAEKPTALDAAAPSADPSISLINKYREFITAHNGAAAHLPPANVQSYNLCGICQAMYVHGSCSSAASATSSMRSFMQQRYAELANNASMLSNLGQPKLQADLAGASAKVGSDLKCEDDSELWWDQCSKVPCMNGMQGIDQSCKYRVAPSTPLIADGDDITNPLGGSTLRAKEHFERSTGKAEVRPGGRRDFESNVEMRIGLHAFTYSYVHSHCGAGADLRMTGMGCHFPRKRWCLYEAFLSHYQSCGNIYCAGCLWTCVKQKDQQAQLESHGTVTYTPSTSLLDTILPQECVQNVDAPEANNPEFRKSLCLDPTLVARDCLDPSCLTSLHGKFSSNSSHGKFSSNSSSSLPGGLPF